MKPETAPKAPRRTALAAAPDGSWRERAGRLFADFERPAKAMVRRAFRDAFSADEVDDIYSGAWLGTLRALAGRHDQLTDDEVRSYLLTAVANQAAKELRRRKRKPTTPLELIGDRAADRESPEERVTSAEESRVTRDLLSSLPKRRRAVILLRYGWGLEPSQVCSLIAGLSPRAYRKEVTRGVDELTEKMRAFERGDWCADREPILKAFAAGLADAEQRRQAQAHLSHCRACADFVTRLGGHLHDLGSAAAVPAAVHGLDSHVGLGERLVELGGRARDAAHGLLGRGATESASEATSTLVSSGAGRGSSAAGAGLFAKLAGLGVGGKLAVACVGGGVAATACIAAGVTPLELTGQTVREGDGRHPTERREPSHPVHVTSAPSQPPVALPSQVGNEVPPPPVGVRQGTEVEAEPAPVPEPAPPPTSTTPVSESAPPVQQEFGVPSAAAPVTPPPGSSSSAPGEAAGGTAGGGTAVEQEFGP